MSHSDAPTRFQLAPEAERLATTNWDGDAADLLPVPTPGAPTQVFPNDSTPGPNAPDRRTLPEPTAERADHLGTLGRVPAIPGYEVERFVAKGGMGLVYRARHAATGRVVALKLTNPRGAHDDLVRDRFISEVHTLAAIKHPNIVPLYDAGEWFGFHYCTMEFAPGGTLNDRLDRVRADLRLAVGILVKVCRGVAAMHQAGILHRDLKPMNILFGADDEPMVADFGLAKWIEHQSELSLTGLPVGTKQYMSPEQTRGGRQPYTPACDVWALGVTLYELATGQRPFAEDGVTDIYHLIRTAEPEPMSAHAPAVPAEIQAVVSKCLQKNPECRYANAAELADDLERWLREEPVRAPLPPDAGALAPVPVRKSGRSRVARGAVGVSAVVALAVALGFMTGRGADPKPPTLAQQFESNGQVELTNAEGQLHGALAQELESELHQERVGGYTRFTRGEFGTANLFTVPPGCPYRVTAQVSVGFVTTHPAVRGGVFVGRREWNGLDVKHESMVLTSLSPRYDTEANARTLHGAVELYWRPIGGNGARTTHSEQVTAWDRGKKEDDRFVPVQIDVRGDIVDVSIDGSETRRFSEPAALSYLALTNELQQKNLLFPAYLFDAPAFGEGVGIFCLDSTCVVRNLTVSKLK